MMIRSNKVLRSAKGQPCTARFPGICSGNAETTVWCHLNGAAFGKGMGIKAHDILGFHGCSSCHEYYDRGHATRSLLSHDSMLECVLEAVCITYVRLVAAGIVVVPQDEEQPSRDRPVKPRKSKAERQNIPSRVDAWPAGRKIQSRNPLRRSKSP